LVRSGAGIQRDRGQESLEIEIESGRPEAPETFCQVGAHVRFSGSRNVADEHLARGKAKIVRDCRYGLDPERFQLRAASSRWARSLGSMRTLSGFPLGCLARFTLNRSPPSLAVVIYQSFGFALLGLGRGLGRAADHKTYLRVISRYFQRSAAFMVATAIRRLESRQPISAHWKRHWGERGR
jgi:hypothetical protein